MQCSEFDDEETDLEMELDLEDDLHDLTCEEELDYWDAISPYGWTEYDGTRFYD